MSTTQKAFLHQQLVGTEVVFVTVTDASATCASLSAAKPAKGDQRIELRLPWLTGYYDFSGRTATGRLDQYQGSYWLKVPAKSGSVRVRSTPTTEGSTGRIRVKVQRGGQDVDLELDVAISLR